MEEEQRPYPSVDDRPDSQVVPSDATQSKESSLRGFLKELPVLVLTAVVVAWLIKSFVIQPFVIPTGSMEPTLIPGDRVLVNKFIYRFRQPQPGDVIVFIAPSDATRDFIKRIVAVAGQKVEMRQGKVYVDGKPRLEPYLSPRSDVRDFGPVVVPQGNVFVMGDNRTESFDSRWFGPLQEKKILGEAFVVYWPAGRLHTL